jgi:hypothetical protein
MIDFVRLMRNFSKYGIGLILLLAFSIRLGYFFTGSGRSITDRVPWEYQKLAAHFQKWPGPDVDDPAWETELGIIEDEIFALRREIKWLERDDEDF